MNEKDGFALVVSDVRSTVDETYLIGMVSHGQFKSGELVMIQSPHGSVLTNQFTIATFRVVDDEFGRESNRASSGKTYALTFKTDDLDFAALGYDADQHRLAQFTGVAYPAATNWRITSPPQGSRPTPSAGTESIQKKRVTRHEYFRLAFSWRLFWMLCGYLGLSLLAILIVVFHDALGYERVRYWQREFYGCEFLACMMTGWLGGEIGSEKSSRPQKVRAIWLASAFAFAIAVVSAVVAFKFHLQSMIWTAPLVVANILVPRIWHAAHMLDAGREESTSMFIQGAIGGLAFFFVAVALAAKLRCDLYQR